MNNFARRFIRMRLFLGGAGLELLDEDAGKKEATQLERAKPGTCSKK